MPIADRAYRLAKTAVTLADGLIEQANRRRMMGRLMPPVAPGFEPRPGPVHRAGSDKASSRLSSDDALFGRIALSFGPSWDRLTSYVGTALEPDTIYSVMVQRNNGYPQLWVDLVEQAIERDGHLGAVYDARRQGVITNDVRVHPRGQSPVALANKSFIEAAIDEVDGLSGAFSSLLSASAYAYSACEIVWTRRRVRFLVNGRSLVINAVVPQWLPWVPPKHFVFDLASDAPLIYSVDASGHVPLPDHKFVFHVADGTSSAIARRGFMGACIWLHAAKQWSSRDWLIYAKIFGIPQILAKYPEGKEEYETHRTKYQRILKDWGEGIPAIIPDDLMVDVSRDAGGGRSGDVHGAIIGWANAEISKRVLGSTLTVEMAQTGSYNAAAIHAEAPQTRMRADARGLAETIRRDLFRSIIKLNLPALASAYGVPPEEIAAHVPTCSWRIDREMTVADRLSVIGKGIEWNVPMPKRLFYDEFGVDAPQAGEELIKGPIVEIADKGAVTTADTIAAADEPVTTGGEGEPPQSVVAEQQQAQAEQAALAQPTAESPPPTEPKPAA